MLTWPDLNLPPINLLSAPKTMKTNIKTEGICPICGTRRTSKTHLSNRVKCAQMQQTTTSQNEVKK